ncbi:MAG: hypothetical protein FWD17_01045 [Polyangiaceae bacterium]|nr:hypothetical protein [Polyangiaceae bacterium]
MPVPAALESDPAVVGPLGGLRLAAVHVDSPMLRLRAVRWWRDLARLGVHAPLFVVHDIGLLYAVPPAQAHVPAGAPPVPELTRAQNAPELVASYHTLVADLAEGAAPAQRMRLGDDLVVVVLARILDAAGAAATTRPPWPETLPLDAELTRDLEPQLPRLFASLPRQTELAFLDALVRNRLRVLTLVDALDVDTLRLLGMLGPETAAAGALAHVDLLAALSNPASNAVVHFSLELLPSVLETHRARVSGTHAVHGYGGIGRRGTIDSMVLTELAWHDDELARRMLDGETLYYTREQAPDEAARLHYVIIDASASMRGDREVFARGLAIALCKKLQLGGEEVWMRFFDSRLYEVHRARARAPLPVSWLLGFRGERGRNPARVFAQLSTELALLRSRDPRDLAVHLITHGALHVPRALVQEVRRLSHLLGVFILPSGGTLDLEWLDLLESYAVVDHPTIEQSAARARAASKIVAEAGARTIDARRRPG